MWGISALVRCELHQQCMHLFIWLFLSLMVITPAAAFPSGIMPFIIPLTSSTEISTTLVVAPLPEHARCKVPLRVGFNDWPPYIWLDSSGQVQGLDAQLLRAIAAKLHCRIDFINAPIKRAHQMLKAGKVDMLMSASKTEDRTQYAHFSKPYRYEKLLLFQLSTSPKRLNVTQWEDIFSQKIKILVPENGWYGESYHQLQPRLQQEAMLVLSPDTEKSVQMLRYGRADVIIGDSLAMPYSANKRENIQLFPLGLVIAEEEIHFMFSKVSMSPADVAAFDCAISTLLLTGEVENILQQWQPTPVND